ncbi:MAG: hypothetical protein GY888_30765, partial [Planctomycetaceae bacterium]|nr:hypothetical protein [Planctomycetaceae bacterium]
MRSLFHFLAASILLLSATFTQAADTPHWIWGKTPRDGEQSVAFQATFQGPSDTQAVTLWIANAYCDCEVLLNGQTLTRIRPFQPPTKLVIKPRRGKNSLGMICHGVAGPSALAARLQMESGAVLSNTSWQVTELNGPINDWSKLGNAKWTPATSFGILSERTWKTAGATTHVADDYTQWKRALEQTGSTAADQLRTQPDFQVERLYSAGPGEGSWISLAEDPQGRW